MTFLIDNNRITVSTVTDDYTLALGDEGSLIHMNSGDAKTISIPTNATVAFAIGTQIRVSRKGAGSTTISASDGGTTTVNSASGNNQINAQHAVATIVKVGTDEWVLFGSLTGA
jgi:hypothetical protein